jgi:Tfp pilus assembly protein PilO
LKVSKSEKKRNRAIIVLLLPVVVILWIFGWSLYWIDRQRNLENLNLLLHLRKKIR